MFPIAPSVSEQTLKRVAERQRLCGDAAVASLDTILGPMNNTQSKESSGAAITRLLSLYTSPESAKTAYPASITNLIPPSTTTAAPQRKRHHQAPGPSTSTKSATTNAPSATTGAPSMHFEEDFETVNYMGRSFIEPPPALISQVEEANGNVPQCHPPRTLRGGFRGGHAAGIQVLRWAPPRYAHLLFSADLQGEACLWDAQGTRRRIATYNAHTRPVKSLQVTSNSAIMSTGSVDGTVAMWDVEAGACTGLLTNTEQLPVVHHLLHPSQEDALFLVALDKKVALYDVRVSTSKYQREYTGHMGTIFHVSLLGDGTKLLTTAEDKTLRTWDYRIPVQIKQFADAGMHAITHVAHHPTKTDLLAAQSLDNKIIVFKDEGGGRLKKLQRSGDTALTGHNISGTHCQLAFSPDGQYVSSGDITGKLFIWNWSTGELVKSFPAHAAGKMLVSHLWHPLEASRLVTSGWDGVIKNWG